MKRSDRPWVVLATTMLCSLAACGPTVAGGGTEGDSEGSTGGTTEASSNPNPTMPMMTTADPSVGTGDVTGDPGTTTRVPEPTTGPDDTTGGASDSCCEAHSSPGCNEEAVVDCVCAQEAFCCAFEWDQNCVDLAMADCAATCEDPGTTTDEPGTTTTGEPMGACMDLVQIELYPADATHSGAWGLIMSMYEPYEVSGLNQMGGTDGSILYEPEIPCDDTWFIWVRYWEQGAEDSYFATVDGMPMPEAIFEGDCTGGDPPGPNPYAWALLNWRDQGAMACDYVEDPWTPDWTAGVHQIEFSFRESLAMGRIVITNDPAYVPM